jgi:hypothetical protein
VNAGVLFHSDIALSDPEHTLRKNMKRKNKEKENVARIKHKKKMNKKGKIE